MVEEESWLLCNFLRLTPGKCSLLSLHISQNHGSFWMQSTNNRLGQMIFKQYIFGLAISRPKIEAFFGLEPNSSEVEIAIFKTIRWLERDAFMFVAIGVTPDGIRRLVIVLDEDDDKDILKGRLSIPFSPSFDQVLPVLDGPEIWERAA